MPAAIKSRFRIGNNPDGTLSTNNSTGLPFVQSRTGPIGESLVANTNVYDDAAKDVMTGGEGRDWFFARVAFAIPDPLADETDREGDEAWEFLF
jgi:hypothetical protein